MGKKRRPPKVRPFNEALHRSPAAENHITRGWLGVRRDYLAVLVRLSYLSPEIVRAILVGQQPVELMPTRLVMLSRNLPHHWQEQRRLPDAAPIQHNA